MPKAINTKVCFIAHYSDLKPLDSNRIIKINKEHFNRIYDLSIIAGGHENIQACQFYLKCGFKEQNFHYIHHNNS